MGGSGDDPGRGRPSTVPLPIVGEVVRPVLLDRLTARFDAPVTAVVAGAGFGKSTVVAQAVRHNAIAPLGIDAWVSCGPGSENAEQLTRSVLAALGSGRLPSSNADALAALVDAIVARSPVDVCVIVDDCHSIPPSSSSQRLLASLVRRLPHNGHLLFSGRHLPEVPLARLKAAGTLVSVGPTDLAFTPAEVTSVAALGGADPDAAAAMGGWPALVRLALLARPGVDREFLREEVLGELPGHLRKALVALVVTGPADGDEIAAVLGEPTDLAALAEQVPLVSVTGDGRYRAHQLWEAVVVAVTDPVELRNLRRRAHGVLLGARETVRSGAVALAARDWSALSRSAVTLVGRSLSNLPVDTARAWLDHVPTDRHDAPIRLLDAAARYTADTRDPSVEHLLEEVIKESEAAADLATEVAALGLAALVAHGRNDVARLLPLALRAGELAESVREPVIELLASAVTAIVADLRGDPEGVLGAFEGVRWNQLPRDIGMTAQRLRVQALWMTGRAAEAVPIATDAFAESSDPHICGIVPMARWFAGDPGGMLPWRDVTFSTSRNERDAFVASCFRTVVLASGGERERIGQVWTELPLATMAFDNARDSAHVTYARAARAIVDHDEASALEHYRRHLERHPVTEPLGERHLRRWPALGYVCSPELRQWWDRAELGPAHTMGCNAARAVLAARAGRAPGAAPTPAELFTQLPLPWSAELAARWQAMGDRRGSELAGYLVDVVGEAAHAELHHLAETSAGASALLRHVAPRPTVHLQIDVLGPLRLARDGEAVDDDALRRRRVRQLLTLLVVEQTVRRDRAVDLLWPNKPAGTAAQNLRVTLAHLRRLLEPGRAPGDAGYHLRSTGESITLHASADLDVDLWRWKELHAELTRPGRDRHLDEGRLAEVVTCWRGDALGDLNGLEGTEALVALVQTQYVDALLRLGELRIATGDARTALDCGHRALERDPYREQAHRLVLAALLQLDDRAALSKAITRLDDALDDLGVDPEQATEILRRRAHHESGMAITSR